METVYRSSDGKNEPESIEWMDVFATLVYLAVDKDYAPHGLYTQHWDAFREAYRETFGRELYSESGPSWDALADDWDKGE